MKTISRRGVISTAATIALVHRGARAAASEQRRDAALALRVERAKAQSMEPLQPHVSNGDESALPRHAAMFSKGLPHNAAGDVSEAHYAALLKAVESGRFSDMERLTTGGERRLVNPLAAHAFHLEGGDPQRFACPPVPPFSSSEAAVELIELYWQALTRDVPFEDYPSCQLVNAAAKELRVSLDLVFRGPHRGDRRGPYISQFLWQPVPWFSGHIEQSYRTLLPNQDFITTSAEWLANESGAAPSSAAAYDPRPRYIRSGRDLAEHVHRDYPSQIFLVAALILHQRTVEATNGNPYLSRSNPYLASGIQKGFVTFGIAETADWIARVSGAAMKAAWCQKWLVHRRLRPEAFAGRLHQTRTDVKAYPLDPSLMNSHAVSEIFRQFGSYLLPQAYPEASPLHPSYPSGHATVAGACATVLKAIFDENAVLEDCVAAAGDGLTLVPYRERPLTIGNELEKLAFNVAMGRNWAGIHYRSDALAGLYLGEAVAISILSDLAKTYREDFAGFEFTRFDGTIVRLPGPAK